jgi:hypothetical protein
VPAAVGDTLIEVPEPIDVPLQAPLYHFQDAPAPKLPPVSDNPVVCPKQIVAVVALAEIAGMDVSRRFKVKLRQMVVLQIPSARTK